MKTTFKKVLAVVLSLAMVFTSITVYRTTAKAEGEEIGTIEITAKADTKNGIDANWTNPEKLSYLKSYIYTATDAESIDETNVTDEHSAKNGTANWIWNDHSNVTQANVDNVVASKDGTISTKDGGDFVIVVVFYDKSDQVIALGKSNTVTVEAYTNMNLQAKFDRYENKTTAFVSWQLVTNAVSYKAFYGETQIGTTQGESGTWTNFTAPVKEQEYEIVVNAYDAQGTIIATSSIKMPATEKVEETTAEEGTTEEGPTEENPGEGYDTSVITDWTEIPVTGVMTGNKYYIETAEIQNINTVIFGIYPSWDKSPYPGDFGGNCSLVGADFATAVKNNPLTSIWVDGVRYAKGTPQFATVGDQCHIATSLFDLAEGENEKTFVVSVVGTTTKTFAIKVEAGESETAVADGKNIIADAAWNTNPEAEGWNERPVGNGTSFAVASAITENWYSAMVYTSAILEQGKTYNVSFDLESKDIKQFNIFTNKNGDTFLISSDGVQWTQNADGKYTCHVETSFTWNKETVKEQLNFGFGYFSGNDASNVKTADTIAVADGIDITVSNLVIAASVVENPTEEETSEEVTTPEETTTEETTTEEVTTETPIADPIEVVGAEIQKIDGATVIFAWGQNTEQMELGQTYNVYVDGALYKTYEGAQAVSYTFEEPGDHAIVIKASLNGKETPGVTLNVTIEGEAPTEEPTTEEPTTEEPTTEEPTTEEPTTQATVTVDGVEYATVAEGTPIALPTDTNVGYYADGKLYAPGAEYTVAGDVAFTSVKLSIINGASILFADPTALRFTATIEADEAAINATVVSEGILITTADLYSNNGASLTLASEYTKLNVVNSGWSKATGSYSASIVNIQAANYDRNYVAKAYATVKYADGTEATVYSDITNTKSVKGVATAIQNNAVYNSLTTAQKAFVDKFAK